jgi:hypothetical protein
MANPTTNYSFAMPQNSDLVKDLPADFEVFGQAVDTQMKTNADAAIAKTIVDAKGDLIAATAADTVARLAVGTNGQVLTADSAEATGMKWGTVSAGGMTLLSSTTLSGSSVTISSISTTYKTLKIIILGAYGSSQESLVMRLNGDTSGSYCGGFTYGTSVISNSSSTSATIGNVYNTGSTPRNTVIDMELPRYSETSGNQMYSFNGWYPTTLNGYAGAGLYTNKSAAITSITLFPTSGTFSAGTVYIYGVS